MFVAIFVADRDQPDALESALKSAREKVAFIPDVHLCAHEVEGRAAFVLVVSLSTLGERRIEISRRDLSQLPHRALFAAASLAVAAASLAAKELDQARLHKNGPAAERP